MKTIDEKKDIQVSILRNNVADTLQKERRVLIMNSNAPGRFIQRVCSIKKSAYEQALPNPATSILHRQQKR